MESLASGGNKGYGGMSDRVKIAQQEIGQDPGALANLPIDSYHEDDTPPYSVEELRDLIDYAARTFPFDQKDGIANYHLVEDFYKRAEAEIDRQRQREAEKRL